MTTFEKARQFVYRNARPLDLARWQYHFESGSREAVLRALSFYQNADGGFGQGLELDYLNPNSTPISAWKATELLYEVGFTDKEHPIVKGILRYLESGADFDEKQQKWLNTVPSNNDYPHAIWWEYGGESGSISYNPTAALAGFILLFADKDSAIYEKACKIATEAAEWFVSAAPINDNHDLACFIRLCNALEKAGLLSADTMVKFRTGLCESVKLTICPEKEKWAVEYVTKPSDFDITKDSIFYADNAELAEYECDFIAESQLPDGGFNVTWQWWTDYKEYEISANYWKSDFVIRNMLYLRSYGKI